MYIRKKFPKIPMGIFPGIFPGNIPTHNTTSNEDYSFDQIDMVKNIKVSSESNLEYAFLKRMLTTQVKL